ncbi:MAG TPA: hypothetical protein QGF58_29145 [Myxococcota bacterium]|nr:hypothetical protein [Myxococcota bacterium]
MLPLLLLTACDFKPPTAQFDEQFGDQHFKTTISLVELHKVRNGEYPAELSELEYTGQWDAMALQSVEYERLDKGYRLDVVRGWVAEPDLAYPEGFYSGLGLVESNVGRE